MVDTLKELKPGNIVFAGDHIFKIAKMGPVQVKHPGGGTSYEEATIRSCPPAFNGGELNVNDYGNYHIFRFIGGDYKSYARMMDRWHVDMTNAAVGEGEWMPKYDVKGLTKLDLIAYVIAVHGPSTRDFIMRSVAALESLPWVPTSNTEYFSNVADADSKHRYYGSSTESTMCHAGKAGRKQLYGLGKAGQERAKKALAQLGERPARQVDGSPEPSKAVPPIKRAK